MMRFPARPRAVVTPRLGGIPPIPAPRLGGSPPVSGIPQYPWADGELLYAEALNAAFAGLTANTIAALRALNTTPASVCTVLGYAAIGDGGEGQFVYMAADTTSADNGGTIIVDAASHRWYRVGAAARNEFNVLWFGAKGDGSTNDAPAIQAAINALPTSGGTVLFPPKQYAVATTINVGNGGSNAASARGGVNLRGTGGIMSPSLVDNTTGMASQLIWTGTAGGTIVLINGNVQGCGCQNLYFQGNNTAAIGLQLTSASFGDFDNLGFLGCSTAALRLYCNTAGTVAAINTMNNRFHNIFIRIMDTANAMGLLLDAPGVSSPSDPCLNDFENMFIQMPQTNNVVAIYLKLCDSNSFRDILINPFYPSSSSTSIAVLFDYSSAGANNNIFPCSNMFYAIDPKGGSGSNHIQWSNVGTPQNVSAPNQIIGLIQANGALVPNLPNLATDTLMIAYYEYLAQTAAIAAANMYAVPTDGFYSIDYCLTIYGQIGASGTITPVFGAVLSTGHAQTLSGSPQSVDPAHDGFTSSGRLAVHAMAVTWITVQTVYTSVVGSTYYDLRVNVSRIR